MTPWDLCQSSVGYVPAIGRSHEQADGDLSGFWVSATCACSCLLPPVWAPNMVPRYWKPLRLHPGSVIGVLPTFGWCLSAIGNFLACHRIPWSLPLTSFGMITLQVFSTHFFWDDSLSGVSYEPGRHEGGCRHFPTGTVAMRPLSCSQ